jgi:hypothetical protein
MNGYFRFVMSSPRRLDQAWFILKEWVMLKRHQKPEAGAAVLVARTQAHCCMFNMGLLAKPQLL